MWDVDRRFSTRLIAAKTYFEAYETQAIVKG